MKPADLREFAEQLYLSGGPDADFGKEIIETIDEADRTEGYDAIVEDLDKAVPETLKGKEHWRQLEWLTDRSNLLEEIQGDMIPEYAERLKMAGIDCTDTDDIIRALLERLPTEYDL